MADDEQHIRDIQREYLDFLDDEVNTSSISHMFYQCNIKLFSCSVQEDQGIYMAHVKNMIAEMGKRLVVNINDLRRKAPARAAAILYVYFSMLHLFHQCNASK